MIDVLKLQEICQRINWYHMLAFRAKSVEVHKVYYALMQREEAKLKALVS